MALIAKKRTIVVLASCFFILIFTMPYVHAQSIPITQSVYMTGVDFDGKWTIRTEWKASSEDTIKADSQSIYLRSAHLYDFIYLLVDAVADSSIDKGNDHAVVCFDSKNDQSSKPDSNDYCFIAKLGSNKATTLQGSENGEFIVIENHVDLIAIGATSDQNDRYSKVPHASYEFRIPIKLLERTDVYGFYLGVFDYTKSKTFTFPSEINVENSEIPSPAKWGIIYSPDKSLPEYELPILVLILGSLFAVLLSSKNKKLNLIYINR